MAKEWQNGFSFTDFGEVCTLLKSKCNIYSNRLRLPKLLADVYCHFFLVHSIEWRSAQRRRKHCALAVVNFFAPPQTPFPGAQDGQNLISWRSSCVHRSSPNPVWWGSMHAISSYRGNRPTFKHTQTHRQGQGLLQYTAPQHRAQCNYADSRLQEERTGLKSTWACETELCRAK